MKAVKNIGVKEVVIMWDGQNHYFEPGEEKAFEDGVADNIVVSEESLVIPSEETVEEAEEVVEKDEFTETTTKTGKVQYRKNGKLISKDEFEKAQ